MTSLDIDKLVAKICQQTRISLQRADWLGTSLEVKQRLLGRYGRAFLLHLTDNAGKSLLEIQVAIAIAYMRKNLLAEAEEDHVGMLLSFLKSAGAITEEDHCHEVDRAVAQVRKLLRKKRTKGLVGLAYMAALENASLVFIPLLEDVAKSLGSGNLKYTRTHGAADAKHGEGAIVALKAEIEQGDYSKEELQIVLQTFNAARMILKAIF